MTNILLNIHIIKLKNTIFITKKFQKSIFDINIPNINVYILNLLENINMHIVICCSIRLNVVEAIIAKVDINLLHYSKINI